MKRIKLIFITLWLRIILQNLALLALFVFMGCRHDPNRNEVNIYTHRHYRVDQDIYRLFTEETGIEVNVVSASADELIQRLALEGRRSPADILITVDAGRLYRAKQQGLLQPVASELLNQHIPNQFRHPEGYWFGLTYRARILAYHRDRVNPSELSTIEDLTSSQWEGRILTRSSENIYNQSLLASIIAHHGEDSARQWAAGILENMARSPRGNDRDQIRAVAAGQGDVAIVNTYYLGIMRSDPNPEERRAAAALGVFFPNQENRGTHINISGAGIVRHAPNRDHAIRLLEFLSRQDIQQRFADVNFEYPVHQKATVSPLLKEWGDFKKDALDLVMLGVHQQQAVKIFDQVGWR